MRLILGVVTSLLVSTLAACGGGGTDEVKHTKSASPTPDTFVACDLLTQAQRDTAAGATADYSGGKDFYFPDWMCEYGDAPVQTATHAVQYGGMRSQVWAQKLPYIVDTTPAKQKPRKLLAAVLDAAGVSEDDISLLDGDGACDLWIALEVTVDTKIVKGIASWSDSDDENDYHYARATTCSDGVFAEVTVEAPDADSKAGRKRAVATVAAVHANAVKALPH